MLPLCQQDHLLSFKDRNKCFNKKKSLNNKAFHKEVMQRCKMISPFLRAVCTVLPSVKLDYKEKTLFDSKVVQYL